MSAREVFPPIDQVLPHRGTMLLIERIGAFSADAVRVHARVDPQAWYADAEGRMPAWIGIELMAQAIAVHVGMSAAERGEPVRHGVLLGTRLYRCTVAGFSAEGELVIHAHQTLFDSSGLGAYECRIAQGDQTLASATLKVYQPPDFQAFLEQGLSV